MLLYIIVDTTKWWLFLLWSEAEIADELIKYR